MRRDKILLGPANIRCTDILGRREVLIGMSALLGASPMAMAAPIRRIGILGDTPGPQWDVFRKSLVDLGYVEGLTVAFESRYSEGNSARFSSLAAALIRTGVDVIVTE